MPEVLHASADDSQPWRLDWTPEQIERFWSWYATQPALVAQYFSGKVGHSILREISQHIRLRGLVVDFGAGPGLMVDQLLERRIKTVAIDSSIKSVESLNVRLRGRDGFAGAFLSE